MSLINLCLGGAIILLQKVTKNEDILQDLTPLEKEIKWYEAKLKKGRSIKVEFEFLNKTLD